MFKPLINKLQNRFYLVLSSIYLHNEYRGFSQLELFQKAFAQLFPNESTMLKAIQKHTADEKKHYLLFKHYFEKQKILPLQVSNRYGYIDQLILFNFKVTIEHLNLETIITNRQNFYKLCRLIILTENRGMKQVRSLLRLSTIRNNPTLFKIFKIIEHDEPSHFQPYQDWLIKNAAPKNIFFEIVSEQLLHYWLILFRIPRLLINIGNQRLKSFPA